MAWARRAARACGQAGRRLGGCGEGRWGSAGERVARRADGAEKGTEATTTNGQVETAASLKGLNPEIIGCTHALTMDPTRQVDERPK